MFDYEKEYANLVGTIDIWEHAKNTKKPRLAAGLPGVCCVCFRREKSHRVLSLC